MAREGYFLHESQRTAVRRRFRTFSHRMRVRGRARTCLRPLLQRTRQLSNSRMSTLVLLKPSPVHAFSFFMGAPPPTEKKKKNRCLAVSL